MIYADIKKLTRAVTALLTDNELEHGWDDGLRSVDATRDLMEFRWPSENWMTMFALVELLRGKLWAPGWWARWFRHQKDHGLWNKEAFSCIYGAWIHLPALIAAEKLDIPIGREWVRASWAWIFLTTGWKSSPPLFGGEGSGKTYGPWLCAGRRSYERSGPKHDGKPHHIDGNAISALVHKVIHGEAHEFEAWRTQEASWSKHIERDVFLYGITNDLNTLRLARNGNFASMAEVASWLKGFRVVPGVSFRVLRYRHGIVVYAPQTPAVASQGTDSLQGHWWTNNGERGIVVTGNGDRRGDTSAVTTYLLDDRDIIAVGERTVRQRIPDIGALIMEIDIDSEGVNVTEHIDREPPPEPEPTPEPEPEPEPEPDDNNEEEDMSDDNLSHGDFNIYFDENVLRVQSAKYGLDLDLDFEVLVRENLRGDSMIDTLLRDALVKYLVDYIADSFNLKKIGD